ncbi:hypothetical protein MMC12_004143 [Toensbergia leucococca]|nr:hypothetical protein [Toensbergia leucococca]
MATQIGPSYEDRGDFEDAERGFLRALKPCIVKAASGRVIWNNDSYKFLDAECPPTANPSLWRQSQICSKQGLFQVTEGVYQVRGLDISNITFVETTSGVIVIDPLISGECAEAAMGLYQLERPGRSPKALIFTHSHSDHFGGAPAILRKAKKEDDVPIIAPEGFFDEAISENVYAGNAMNRRAIFMYGGWLPRAPDGQIGFGLGMATSGGTPTLLKPTVTVDRTHQKLTVDGIEMEFQITPGTEAPAEMNFYFPKYRALCIAENAGHTLHNLLTLRGALVRDARAWSRYLNESIVLFAHKSDVLFGGHAWPTWGQPAITRFLSEQRDLYAYLHDQTLRMINDGLTGIEIAEDFQLPDSLAKRWHARGYYGSISHNVKAIYQRYMGWFDGNPAHLWEHPPVAAAKRYVDCMGGPAKVIALAKSYKANKDLRFAATLLNHAIFATGASPKAGQTTNQLEVHVRAKEDLAAVYDQLGYGAENGTWRNFYLNGAQELRKGIKTSYVTMRNEKSLMALDIEHVLDMLSIRLDGPRAQHHAFIIDMTVSDRRQRWRLTLSNGALSHYLMLQPGEEEEEEQGSSAAALPAAPDFSFELSQQRLARLILEPEGGVGDVGVRNGDEGVLGTLFGLLVPVEPGFAVVTAEVEGGAGAASASKL